MKTKILWYSSLVYNRRVPFSITNLSGPSARNSTFKWLFTTVCATIYGMTKIFLIPPVLPGWHIFRALQGVLDSSTFTSWQLWSVIGGYILSLSWHWYELFYQSFDMHEKNVSSGGICLWIRENTVAIERKNSRLSGSREKGGPKSSVGYFQCEW